MGWKDVKGVRRGRGWDRNDVNAMFRYDPQNNYTKFLTILGIWEAKVGGPGILKPA